MNTILQQAIALAPKVQAISSEVLSRHIQRNDVVHATWLSLVSGRPAFFLGSPGVDKTGTIQAMASRISGIEFYDVLMPTIVSFEQFMVERTSIIEVPIAGGGKAIRTEDELGRAANSHILFADEIWKAEPRLLQTAIDLAKGDGVRHEGRMVKTPLMAFIAASNELPDPEGNLGAVWSRMTIRVQVHELDRAGKTALVKARLNRDRSVGAASAAAQLTLADVETLRSARPHVEVPESMIGTVLDIYQELIDENSGGFQWAWEDDRRFGRVFDIMQAQALLDGRTLVGKQDLTVLEWLLWDTPEQIAVVKSKVAPYCRTPLMDAQELVDSLLAPTGTVELVRKGNRGKGVEALTQCEDCIKELAACRANASGDSAMSSAIVELIKEISQAKDDVVAVVTGMKR